MNVFSIVILCEHKAGLSLYQEVDVFDVVSFSVDVLLLTVWHWLKKRTDPGDECLWFVLKEIDSLVASLVDADRHLDHQVLRQLIHKVLYLFVVLIILAELDEMLAVLEYLLGQTILLLDHFERFQLFLNLVWVRIIVWNHRWERTVGEGEGNDTQDHEEGLEEQLCWIDPIEVTITNCCDRLHHPIKWCPVDIGISLLFIIEWFNPSIFHGFNVIRDELRK